MRTIQEFVKNGLDRVVPDIAYNNNGPKLNLGPGKRKIIPDTIGVGFPGPLTEVEWKYPAILPFNDNSVAEIHAYQFMEHFSGEDALNILEDCQRILIPGGVMNIVTPYFNSQHQSQALDHKSFWSEETWNWLFGNEYYDDNERSWNLRVHCCFIFGVVYRNLDLFTQLIKRSEEK